VRDRVVGPAFANGCYRAIESAPGANAERLTIRGLRGRDLLRDGIRLRGVRDVVIEDFDLQHSPVLSTGSHLPEGIAVGGDGYSGGGLTIRRGVIRGFRMSSENDPKTGKPRYTNGDGIAIEGGIDGVTITDVLIEDSTDGGVDTKSTNTRIDRVTVRNTNRAFRIWKDLQGGTLTAENFAGGAIWAGR
ncbi:hypothetical protein ACFPQ7_19065, partial [Methylobacterium iners]|uniref:hypothetical protein n=1 Tax=Methylobacterium iners TaxID=418707 RepID=UPI003621AB83